MSFQGTAGFVGPEGLAGEPGKPGLPGLPGVGKPGLPVSVFHNARSLEGKKSSLYAVSGSWHFTDYINFLRLILQMASL